MKKYYSIAIVGGGSAGISVASRLLRASHGLKHRIVIIDPAKKHYYQPLWTLVGGGAAKKESTERNMEHVIPEGVDWLQERVDFFSPNENSLSTESGSRISYEYLVVAAGIQIQWDGIKGLKEAIGKNGVCSNYSYEYVDYTWENIREFKGGTALFTHPNTPVKCGGAPQKIMYLADDYFRKSGARESSRIVFSSANSNIFHVPKYARTLESVVQRKGIETKFNSNLIEVNGDKKEAVLQHLDTNEIETISYDMLHVTPPMKAPDFIQESPLADEKGWVDVDPYTLQHTRFQNVFGIGDCANLPTSKTGAGIRKQAPVVAENLLALFQNRPMTSRYDGYSSCPLVTGYNRLVLAEFDYNGQQQESFPIDQSKERISMYIMKKSFLPLMYWNGMLKGTM